MTATFPELLVSIITPCRNAEAYLPATAASVLGQTWGAWEWIIVDDGSSDSSLAIAEQFARDDPRIQVIPQASRGGPARARNVGIAAARGVVITFIDSDDWWMPTFLERSMAFMLENNHSLVYSSYRIYDDRTGRYRRDFTVPERVSYDELLLSCPISMLTALYRVDRIGKVMLPDIPREDLGLWLDIMKRIPFAYGMRDTLAVYRLRQKSRSHNKLQVALAQWKAYRYHEKLSILKSCRCFLGWMVRGFLKYRGVH